ncbi:tRNA N6-adenosine threonylcarbamoyltransferase [Candidatus Magnetomoraceae bacterium gMMP-15]
MNILGIETSCDETAAAVVTNGTEIKSSIVASQVSVHHPYGGVVPELASRKHIEAIVPVVHEAIEKSGVKPDAIAVTAGPGLIGSLLVGFSFAKAYAFARKLPWIGVNHLYGHIHAVFLEQCPPAFPFTALLVSGGHTIIYYVKSHTEFELMGQTRDDAAGEAYDKVSKMLGTGYPGGKVIDDLAHKGDMKKIAFPRAYLDKTKFDFSFSGIKSAVSRYIYEHKIDYQKQIQNIAAGFQEAVVDVLSYKAITATLAKSCKHLAVAGGVAANSRLRKRIQIDAEKKGISVHIPSPSLCGDNAAMIAALGYHYLSKGNKGDYDDDVFSRIKISPF